MTTSALTRHETDAEDLAKGERALQLEQSQLTTKRTELAERALLDKDSAAVKQLGIVNRRLAQIAQSLELHHEARTRLDDRIAVSRHEAAQDERNGHIEAILSLTAKRAQLLATIEKQADALAGSIAEVWTLNGDALALSHEFAEDNASIRSPFSQRHFSTNVEKLLGRHLHRFNVAQAIRPSNFEEWDWRRSTAVPENFEATLRSLPLK